MEPAVPTMTAPHVVSFGSDAATSPQNLVLMLENAYVGLTRANKDPAFDGMTLGSGGTQ